MPGRFRIWIDVLAGAGLLAALAIAVAVDRPTTSPTPLAPRTGDLPVIVVSGAAPSAPAARKLRLAVTPPIFDDMGKLLNELGEGFRYDTLTPPAIANRPKLLDAYDVLFLTCAPGGEELREPLQDFVTRGGTLYASDFRYDAILAAFGEMFDRKAVNSGVVQDLVADVVDPSLRDVVGAKIPLRFDLPGWKVAAPAGPRVQTLIEGSYRKSRFGNDAAGVAAKGPLLIRFPWGRGTVIFTSFHNEKQNNDLETKLLKYLVFQLVNATVDAEVTQLNEKAGFAPAKSNLLSAPKGTPEVAKSFEHKARGPLRFSLAFRNDGAKLGLTLRSPDGKTHEWEGTSTLILDVPDAAAGEWVATVRAIQIPYENFVFSVTFGTKR